MAEIFRVVAFLSMAVTTLSGATCTPGGEELSLSRTTWIATKVEGNELKVGQPPTVQFQDDGSFSMFAGCNTHHGKAVIGDKTFMLDGPMASTRKLCFEDWRTQLEQDMVDVMGEAEGYEMSGTELELTNASGVPLASFIASKE